MGDFHIDLLKYNKVQKVNYFLDDILSQGFIQVILKPTSITDTSATLIDHIYTNNLVNLKESAIIVTDVADHLATIVIFYDQTKSKKNSTCF